MQHQKVNQLPVTFFLLLKFLNLRFALEETRKELSDKDLPDTGLFDKAEAEDIKTKCSTNLAACHFLLSNHRQVISLSTELLDNDEASVKNVKLLYRRGVSNLVKI